MTELSAPTLFGITLDNATAVVTCNCFRSLLKCERESACPYVQVVMQCRNGDAWEPLLSGIVHHNGCADIGWGLPLLLHVCDAPHLDEFCAALQAAYREACQLLA